MPAGGARYIIGSTPEPPEMPSGRRTGLAVEFYNSSLEEILHGVLKGRGDFQVRNMTDFGKFDEPTIGNVFHHLTGRRRQRRYLCANAGRRIGGHRYGAVVRAGNQQDRGLSSLKNPRTGP